LIQVKGRGRDGGNLQKIVQEFAAFAEADGSFAIGLCCHTIQRGLAGGRFDNLHTGAGADPGSAGSDHRFEVR
jgi:hypothetical protein